MDDIQFVIIKSIFDPLNMTAFIGTEKELASFSTYEKLIDNQHAQDALEVGQLSPSSIFLAHSLELDSIWARAKLVREISEDDVDIEILFIDYGITEYVDQTKIRHLSKEFINMQCPTSYKSCKLKNLQLTEKYYETDGLEFCKETIFNKKLKCECEYSLSTGVYELIVFINMNGNEIPFQDIAVGYGYATLVDTKDAITKTETTETTNQITSNQDDLLLLLSKLSDNSKEKNNTKETERDFEKEYWMKNMVKCPDYEDLDLNCDFENDIKNNIRMFGENKHCVSPANSFSGYKNTFKSPNSKISSDMIKSSSSSSLPTIKGRNEEKPVSKTSLLQQFKERGGVNPFLPKQAHKQTEGHNLMPSYKASHKNHDYANDRKKIDSEFPGKEITKVVDDQNENFGNTEFLTLFDLDQDFPSYKASHKNNDYANDRTMFGYSVSPGNGIMKVVDNQNKNFGNTESLTLFDLDQDFPCLEAISKGITSPLLSTKKDSNVIVPSRHSNNDSTDSFSHLEDCQKQSKNTDINCNLTVSNTSGHLDEKTLTNGHSSLNSHSTSRSTLHSGLVSPIGTTPTPFREIPVENPATEVASDLKIIAYNIDVNNIYIPDCFNPFDEELMPQFLAVIQNESNNGDELGMCLKRCADYTIIVNQSCDPASIVTSCMEACLISGVENVEKLVVIIADYYKDKPKFEDIIKNFFDFFMSIGLKDISVFIQMYLASQSWPLSHRNQFVKLLEKQMSEILLKKDKKNIKLLKEFLIGLSKNKVDLKNAFTLLQEGLKKLMFYDPVAMNLKDEVLDIFIAINQKEDIIENLAADNSNSSKKKKVPTATLR